MHSVSGYKKHTCILELHWKKFFIYLFLYMYIFVCVYIYKLFFLFLSISVCIFICMKPGHYVCVVHALIRASYKNKGLLCNREFCVHLCTLESVCFLGTFVCVHMWLCDFCSWCVRAVWQISCQFSALEDNGVLLQWPHSADMKSADDDCGWLCSLKRARLNFCIYTNSGQTNDKNSCVWFI